MKRVLMALVVLALVSSAAFAQFEMSAGVGGNFAMGFQTNEYGYKVNSYTWYDNYKDEMTNVGFGGYVFFDATYVEATAGYFYSSTGIKRTNTWNYGSGEKTKEITGTDPFVYGWINLGLFGKYPFDLGAVKIFPLVGIEYSILASVSIGGVELNVTATDYNSLWIKGGVGADIGITDEIYVRLEALFGLRLQNANEKNDESKYIKNNSDSYSTAHYDTGLEMGFDIKLAVGYKISK